MKKSAKQYKYDPDPVIDEIFRTDADFQALEKEWRDEQERMNHPVQRLSDFIFNLGGFSALLYVFYKLPFWLFT